MKRFWENIVYAIVIAKGRNSDAGPLAQSVELCTYEVNSRYARVPSSILGGSTVIFFSLPIHPCSTEEHTVCDYT